MLQVHRYDVAEALNSRSLTYTDNDAYWKLSMKMSDNTTHTRVRYQLQYDFTFQLYRCPRPDMIHIELWDCDDSVIITDAEWDADRDAYTLPGLIVETTWKRWLRWPQVTLGWKEPDKAMDALIHGALHVSVECVQLRNPRTWTSYIERPIVTRGHITWATGGLAKRTRKTCLTGYRDTGRHYTTRCVVQTPVLGQHLDVPSPVPDMPPNHFLEDLTITVVCTQRSYYEVALQWGRKQIIDCHIPLGPTRVVAPLCAKFTVDTLQHNRHTFGQVLSPQLIVRSDPHVPHGPFIITVQATMVVLAKDTDTFENYCVVDTVMAKRAGPHPLDKL